MKSALRRGGGIPLYIEGQMTYGGGRKERSQAMGFCPGAATSQLWDSGRSCPSPERG